MTINQGEIFWIQGADGDGSGLGTYPHPYVVLQEDLFNHSRITTVVVCALTTNSKQANLYGNVLLDAGEAYLPKQSVVVVSKISSVEKNDLGDYIGSLSSERVEQILAGLRFLQATFYNRVTWQMNCISSLTRSPSTTVVPCSSRVWIPIIISILSSNGARG